MEIEIGFEVKIGNEPTTAYVWFLYDDLCYLIFRDGTAAGPYSKDLLSVKSVTKKRGERAIRNAGLLSAQNR